MTGMSCLLSFAVVPESGLDFRIRQGYSVGVPNGIPMKGSAPSGSAVTKLDEIGEWSVDKLCILKAYAEQYSQVLQSQKSATGVRRFRYGYIDGFAGAGEHMHKKTHEIVPGSPLNALRVKHRFDEYHFVDLDPDRVARLRAIAASEKNVTVHHGDCNTVLLNEIFPRFQFQDFARALCFLDPYGMHVSWDVLKQAGTMGTIEIFLNFPVADINRNAKRTNPNDVEPDHRKRMTLLWGDETWHSAMFKQSTQGSFFEALGDSSPDLENAGNDGLAEAFQERLKRVGGFQFVPKPVPMRNSKNAVVYYLFFAGNNEAGNRIASHIFKKYRAP